MQKCPLGEVGSETIISDQNISGLFIPKIIKIEQCLTKLLMTTEMVVFLTHSMCLHITKRNNLVVYVVGA